MSKSKIFCTHCKKEVPLLGAVGRKEECPFCRSDLHICLNCIHYDVQSYNECREPQADRIVEKDRSNFCDFFDPNDQKDGRSAQAQKDELLSAAEALFKKK